MMIYVGGIIALALAFVIIDFIDRGLSNVYI